VLRLVLAAVVSALTAPALAQGPPPVREGAFVGVDGTRFAIDGQAFHVIGANVAVMHGREQRAHMEETLEAAARDGLSLVRVWALGEYLADAPEWARAYAFRVGPEGWVEESFAHLDRVLATARRLGLRVVIVLANRWGDYGGVPAYLKWAGVEVDRHPTPLELTAFWESQECEARYREHVARVIGRVNALTGVPYAEDPTIFAWELMNEADAAGAIGEEAMLRWMERQLAFVRTLDRAHMISAGHIGYLRRRARSLWARVCSLEGVSYCDSHAYPLRDGRVRDVARLARWIDDRVQLAHVGVGKPLLFGEIGVPTRRRDVYGRNRARWLSIFVRRVLADGAAGALLWAYVPSTSRPRTYTVYASGDRERRTADMRRALSIVADLARDRAPRSMNPRIGEAQGDAPLFDPVTPVRGPATIASEWRDEGDARSLLLDPLAFERARFELAGTWSGEVGLPHFYGSGEGTVSFRFRSPRAAPSSIFVRARVSSELPGASGGASEADTSVLTIAIDGLELGTITAPPDDGAGAWVELAIEDPGVLAAIARRRVHRLEIRAGSEGAGGVCIYARTERGEPAGIELRWR
jgi:mannan endo-1,4-beta-mannosidase